MAVALYARVSTVKQAEKDLSIPDQLRQMRDWCARSGYAVAMEYVELGRTATDDRRPMFQQMIAEATMDPPPFEAIIVHSQSRFFRDAIDFGLYERQLNKANVQLVSITQPTASDPAGGMMRRLFSVFDEYQSKENGKHTLRAINENARQGFFNGSGRLRLSDGGDRAARATRQEEAHRARSGGSGDRAQDIDLTCRGMRAKSWGTKPSPTLERTQP